MFCAYESFYIEYEPKSDKFVFDNAYDDLIHTSILVCIRSLSSPSHESMARVPHP